MTAIPSPRTVLVAEDSRFFRSMLSYALDEDGLRCVAAATGEEALAILGRELPEVHLLLTDLGMPGMNGFELIERVRALPGGLDLPIIVISQFGLNAVEREILGKHGVRSILTKSASVERILYEVREALFPEERERRRTPRAPLTIPVTVRTPRHTYLTHTFNVSEEGMFLTLGDQEPPSQGTEVDLKFWVPDQDEIFNVKATVAWMNAIGPELKRSHPAGFGVRFLAPDERTLNAIARFLRSAV